MKLYLSSAGAEQEKRVLDATLSILSTPKRKRLLKTSDAQQRTCYALSELLLAWAVYIEWNIVLPEETITEGVYGKPGLRQNGYEFNKSHSGNCVLIGVDERAIGVDIQQHKYESRQPARRIMDDDTYHAWCKSEDRDKTFFDFWSRKESVLKWSGLGLSGLGTSDPHLPEGVSASSVAAPEGYSAYVCGTLDVSKTILPTVVNINDLLEFGEAMRLRAFSTLQLI